MPDNSRYQHFSEIVLLPDELKTLKRLQKTGNAKLEKDLKNILQNYDLIEISGTYNSYTCVLSDNGKRYLLFLKNRTKHLWLENAWIPIIVAFATTLITNYILPKLPQIIKWFCDTLAKTTS